MNLVILYLVICQLVTSSLAFDIKGRLDLRLRNVTQHDISRSYFTLYKIQGPNEQDKYSELVPYSKSATLQNTYGEFTFTDVPVDLGLNRTTYFTINSHSTEFNLKPNRVLIKITGNGSGQEPSLTAFENKFGREYFPSADIAFPETLKLLPLDTSGRLVITTINKQPFRRFMQIRNPGIFQSGPIASILTSKFKLAGVITVLFLVLFPIMLEKFDPETAKQMRQEKLQRENAKYVSK
ncbi:unnamed protein product [Kluyveromyces dobzhanskii CBS 2104]|uniref:Protein SOP4 n=1 Tax=Kluyveromyces dobzhanskii CBS 2104 TaxID=1427455 RepID=A0A0A8L0J0_9SACH|nr:unnamed protein product [Kluyveromyces dobzhanskii CBS 2104]